MKPYIPRQAQIFLRQKIASYKVNKYKNIWPIDPKSFVPPEGWKGWPEDKMFALVLTHDVETQKGHDRCCQLMVLEEKLGFLSSFNFVPERYNVSSQLIQEIKNRGFEVGVHGLKHDGKLFLSKKIFDKRAEKINIYLKEWNATGFRSPAMHHNLEWITELDIQYDLSTFDTDPFEPQSDGVGKIFPFWVNSRNSHKGYVELPYTLPQDFTMFIILNEINIEIWKRKLDWIASNGGMALLNTHPDYINFKGKKIKHEEYEVGLYYEFLNYVRKKYQDNYWNALPHEVALYYKNMIFASK